MSYLSDEQITELSSESLIGTQAIVKRASSQVSYNLVELKGHGMKGVVWKAKDDLGENVALKIISENEYSGRSLVDEMSEAMKLSNAHFAEIKFFGELKIESINFSVKYLAISTKWIEDDTFDMYINKKLTSINQFIQIAEQLFTALSDLQANNLCHDDLHYGNVLIEKEKDVLSREEVFHVKIIDTGTVKRVESRRMLLDQLRTKIIHYQESGASTDKVDKLKTFLSWKQPDDHLRVIDCLLRASNALYKNYFRMDFWERKFLDRAHSLFERLTDTDLTRRLDDPRHVIGEIQALAQQCLRENENGPPQMKSPFDYISAEMIRNDREFTSLFSIECPWLKDCEALEPLYIYGPRGSGKSSVLRWLSFKTHLSDPARQDFSQIRDVGIYMSCSVELRSRFWLLDESKIEHVKKQTIQFFNLLLLEELFDTLSIMSKIQLENRYNFGLNPTQQHAFTEWVIKRMLVDTGQLRLQGQGYFDYLRSLIRSVRWETWASIRNAEFEPGNPDPSLVMDVCRELSEYFEYFNKRGVVFLVDDYSNQRIPSHLQKQLNQTISFAKQGTPIFKMSSEYKGVDLEGIQEGREVVEINIGEKYSTLQNIQGSKFLADIVNIRLSKVNPKYRSTIEQILGPTKYNAGAMAKALEEERRGEPFYYHGIDCVHWLCTGDLALALNVIRKIFDKAQVNYSTTDMVDKKIQHDTIQQFAHDEIRRINYIVPHGEIMKDIVCYLGAIARVFVKNKKSTRKDKKGNPVCKTHIDIRLPVLQELEEKDKKLNEVYSYLTSRSILISLQTSRSRIEGGTERVQLKRIYLPAFKAPFQRDVPVKVDTFDDIKSLLSNPRAFAERELKKSDIDTRQLEFALNEALIKPRE